jgi:translation initiation factor 4A
MTQELDYDEFEEILSEVHSGKLLKGIYDYGFTKPSPIQAKTIQPICSGRDIIAQSQSGTGKTGAFVIGSLARIKIDEKYPQVVILANTRELSMQIKNVASEIGKHIGIDICLCVGGPENNDNTIGKNLIEAGKSQMLVCTPGRLCGLIKVCPTLLSKLQTLVFDEADILLSHNFIEQTQNIIVNCNKDTQFCLFSATANSLNIQSNKDNFMESPIEIYIKKEEIKVDLIKNYIVDAREEKYKVSILEEIYENINVCQSVIFVNTVRNAIELGKQLKKSNHSVGVIHGQLTHLERMKVLQRFRDTSIRVLVATDIIARGIDIQKVGLIINYDIPIGDNFEEVYIHRVGRTGRYGKLGVAINMVCDKYENNRLRRISKKYGVNFARAEKLSKINYDLSGGYSINVIDYDSDAE